MGDFNAAEDNPAIGYLKSPDPSPGLPGPLLDSFRLCHPDASDVGTFHAFTGRTGGAKIDHILIPADRFHVLDAAIIRTHQARRYPSDHYPVTARLFLPRRELDRK